MKIALARLYAKTGNKRKAEELMKSVTGVADLTSGSDLYAASLRDDINVSQTERDARQTLNNIGEEFDAGEFDRLGPSAFSAMNLVALAWGRIGWARTLGGQASLHAQWF